MFSSQEFKTSLLFDHRIIRIPYNERKIIPLNAQCIKNRKERSNANRSERNYFSWAENERNWVSRFVVSFYCAPELPHRTRRSSSIEIGIIDNSKNPIVWISALCKVQSEQIPLIMFCVVCWDLGCTKNQDWFLLHVTYILKTE